MTVTGNAASPASSTSPRPSRPPSPRKRFAAQTRDGLNLAVQEWGAPDGPEVLLIHGGLNCHSCWEHQVSDPKLADARIVTYDMRGHGDSDKPLDPSFYGDGALWGHDLHAVMEAAGLRRPVLVGWSFGGVIISAYLQNHGHDRLAAVNWVGAIPAISADLPPSAVNEVVPYLISPHLPERIFGLRTWLRACFATPPAEEIFERLLASSATALTMLPTVGQQIIPDPRPALRAFDRPALVTQGALDRITLPEVGRRLAADIPGAELSIYEGAGHALFVEAPERFATELLALIARSR